MNSLKEIPFKWYEFPIEARVAMSALSTTGLNVIPGPIDEMPSGVMFNNERYYNYSIGPFGFVVLGNAGTYRQELSKDKLFPDTNNPIIVPFGEFLKVHG